MITIQDGKFHFNGVRKNTVIGRSSFKLANMLTYHYTGQGGGQWGVGSALRWIEHNQALFGEDVVLRVFLETAGWDPNSTGMFGSEPQDKGAWNVPQLRDGRRETAMHPVARNVLEWLFATSESTGVAFEICIIATLKHNNVPTGEIDHVIRQTGVEMGRLALKYPRSLIVPSACNEWNAHSRFTLNQVDMWATRWHRDEYWPGAPLIVDGGGGDTFDYNVGSGGYQAGMIHPLRSGRDWEQMPDMAALRMTAGGLPVGFTESMYYVEEEDVPRAEQWYRNRSGWSHLFDKYSRFAEQALESTDYFIFHDEKGAQCDPSWPRPQTRLEAHFGEGGSPDPPPKPLFERIITQAYLTILGRIPDSAGLQSHNEQMLLGRTEADMRESLIRSQEYIDKNAL